MFETSALLTKAPVGDWVGVGAGVGVGVGVGAGAVTMATGFAPPFASPPRPASVSALTVASRVTCCLIFIVGPPLTKAPSRSCSGSGGSRCEGSRERRVFLAAAVHVVSTDTPPNAVTPTSMIGSRRALGSILSRSPATQMSTVSTLADVSLNLAQGDLRDPPLLAGFGYDLHVIGDRLSSGNRYRGRG